MNEEGVIKFNCNWTKGEAPDENLIARLDTWRDRLYDLSLIGEIEGIGYGNISLRANKDHFIITGSGTGTIQKLQQEHYTTVTGFDPDKNSIETTGPIIASSESLTHAAIYSHLPEAGAVFHIHHAGLWKKLLELLPFTSTDVPYGTPAMAYEVNRLLDIKEIRESGIFAMGGHQDGIIAFGNTTDEAGRRILQYFAF
jgi:L-ribulose-5-phosphate 4-epimerase